MHFSLPTETIPDPLHLQHPLYSLTFELVEAHAQVYVTLRPCDVDPTKGSIFASKSQPQPVPDALCVFLDHWEPLGELEGSVEAEELRFLASVVGVFVTPFCLDPVLRNTRSLAYCLNPDEIAHLRGLLLLAHQLRLARLSGPLALPAAPSVPSAF